jgi:hypothetical protein
VIAQDPQYDQGGMFIHPTKRQIQAVGFYKDKLEWQVLDKSIARDFQTISKVRRGEFSVVTATWLIKLGSFLTVSITVPPITTSTTVPPSKANSSSAINRNWKDYNSPK